jgi:hypothetical protein
MIFHDIIHTKLFPRYPKYLPELNGRPIKSQLLWNCNFLFFTSTFHAFIKSFDIATIVCSQCRPLSCAAVTLLWTHTADVKHINNRKWSSPADIWHAHSHAHFKFDAVSIHFRPQYWHFLLSHFSHTHTHTHTHTKCKKQTRASYSLNILEWKWALWIMRQYELFLETWKRIQIHYLKKSKVVLGEKKKRIKLSL